MTLSKERLRPVPVSKLERDELREWATARLRREGSPAKHRRPAQILRLLDMVERQEGAVRDAVEAERNACAKVASGWGETFYQAECPPSKFDTNLDRQYAASVISEAIRARGDR